MRVVHVHSKKCAVNRNNIVIVNISKSEIIIRKHEIAPPPPVQLNDSIEKKHRLQKLYIYQYS